MTPGELAICVNARREREYQDAQRALWRMERRAEWYAWRPVIGAGAMLISAAVCAWLGLVALAGVGK